MRKSIFAFFIFILFSSCYTTRNSGCDCPGMSEETVEKIEQQS